MKTEKALREVKETQISILNFFYRDGHKKWLVPETSQT
jgi:hypothetical protein